MSLRAAYVKSQRGSAVGLGAYRSPYTQTFSRGAGSAAPSVAHFRRTAFGDVVQSETFTGLPKGLRQLINVAGGNFLALDAETDAQAQARERDRLRVVTLPQVKVDLSNKAPSSQGLRDHYIALAAAKYAALFTEPELRNIAPVVKDWNASTAAQALKTRLVAFEKALLAAADRHFPTVDKITLLRFPKDELREVAVLRGKAWALAHENDAHVQRRILERLRLEEARKLKANPEYAVDQSLFVQSYTSPERLQAYRDELPAKEAAYAAAYAKIEADIADALRARLVREMQTPQGPEAMEIEFTIPGFAQKKKLWVLKDETPTHAVARYLDQNRLRVVREYKEEGLHRTVGATPIDVRDPKFFRFIDAQGFTDQLTPWFDNTDQVKLYIDNYAKLLADYSAKFKPVDDAITAWRTRPAPAPTPDDPPRVFVKYLGARDTDPEAERGVWVNRINTGPDQDGKITIETDASVEKRTREMWRQEAVKYYLANEAHLGPLVAFTTGPVAKNYWRYFANTAEFLKYVDGFKIEVVVQGRVFSTVCTPGGDMAKCEADLIASRTVTEVKDWIADEHVTEKILPGETVEDAEKRVRRMYPQYIATINKIDVPYIVRPGETEAQIIDKVRQKFVDGTILDRQLLEEAREDDKNLHACKEFVWEKQITDGGTEQAKLEMLASPTCSPFTQKRAFERAYEYAQPSSDPDYHIVPNPRGEARQIYGRLMPTFHKKFWDEWSYEVEWDFWNSGYKFRTGKVHEAIRATPAFKEWNRLVYKNKPAPERTWENFKEFVVYVARKILKSDVMKFIFKVVGYVKDAVTAVVDKTGEAACDILGPAGIEAVGAGIGTAVAPGIGTTVGGMVGGVAGGLCAKPPAAAEPPTANQPPPPPPEASFMEQYGVWFALGGAAVVGLGLILSRKQTA